MFMLYVSLVCSGVILIAAVLAARYAKNPSWVAFFWALGAAALPLMFLMLALPAVWLQLGILTGGLLIAGAIGYSRQLLVPVSIAAVAIAYGVVGTSALREQRERDELRAQYPFESIESRLPQTIPPSSPGDTERLHRLEDAIEKQGRWRSFSLERLHNSTVDKFVDSSGFGAARMGPFELSEADLKGKPRPETPEQGDYFRPTPKSAEKLPARPDTVRLGKLHEDGFLDFVNPGGFGYVKDRRHVAGFLSHGFSKTPDPAGEWKVATLELVGLLQHPEPVVYVSSKLPRMDELKAAPTRPLDAFESTALKALREGADLHVSESPDDPRFLGAIRATKQCLACHGGERGALLGAFTYRLTPVGR
jgi:hypothetical protein